jgi:guanine deaminase
MADTVTNAGQWVAYRGTILRPLSDVVCQRIEDGAVVVDGDGRVAAVGAWREISQMRHLLGEVHGDGTALLLPAMVDNHTHISQHLIRGQFDRGIAVDDPRGRLVASLLENVFPQEAKCATELHTASVVAAFAAETMSRGTLGGIAYMTVHPSAVRMALQMLPDTWRVGLVLMDQHCPDYLRTDASGLERDVGRLVEEFGDRLVISDRFAVACSSALRLTGVKLATRWGLRLQTHLNEQSAEKQLVEQELYKGYGSYTAVYERDGLLANHAAGGAIMAHCIHMRDPEWEILRRTGAAVAHCPTSNVMLGSGVMDLPAVQSAGVDWSICTDVGAGPSSSLLAEVCAFAAIHRERGQQAALLCQALHRTTTAAAAMAGVGPRAGGRSVGSLLEGDWASFVEFGQAGGGALADLLPLSEMPEKAELSAVRRWLVERVVSGLPRARRVVFRGRVVHRA